jgi:hypothetical protein
MLSANYGKLVGKARTIWPMIDARWTEKGGLTGNYSLRGLVMRPNNQLT